MVSQAAFVAFALLMFSVVSAETLNNPFQRVSVIQVKPAQVDANISAMQRQGCHNWRLSKSQVQRFFALSQIEEARAIHDHYYWLPCRVNGEISDAAGQRWQFSINAAAHATVWMQGNEPEVHLGCAQPGCAALSRIMPDQPGE